MKRKALLLLLLILVLPISILLVKQIQDWRGKAEYLPPNLAIYTQNSEGPLGRSWCGLAQGGEMSASGFPVRLNDVIPQLSIIRPCFVRIDHLFDAYTKVVNNNGNLLIDWTLLDQTVADIRQTGATPFLSLSYLPSSLAKNGDITGEPTDWALWQQLVKKTIEHYSGVYGQNIPNIYYEVWNEPDLFGNWRVGYGRDYLNLYRYASYAAGSVTNTNTFYLGGPSTTHPMETWLSNFLTTVKKENLRLDFISWHRYSFTPSVLKSDNALVSRFLEANPEYQYLPRFVTEYGSYAENNPVHDSLSDAYHLLSSVTYLDNNINGLFSFEIKDSPSPLKKQYWGRWGLFTNEEYGLVAKPRFEALKFLNNLSGGKLSVAGFGTYISALATKNKESYQALVVYYLPPGAYAPFSLEAVPLAFLNLSEGNYSFRQQKVFTNEETTSTESVTTGSLYKVLPMTPNSAYLITLIKQ